MPSHFRQRNLNGFLAFWKDELEQMSSKQILHWAVDAFHPRLALKTTFEPEGCVILSLISEIVSEITVLCNEIDFQMQRFWSVTKRFRAASGLQIVPTHAFDEDDRPSFDLILDGTRRRGRPGIGVLQWDPALETPTVSPLVRWTHDALLRKLRRDAILDSSFINIWKAEC